MKKTYFVLCAFRQGLSEWRIKARGQRDPVTVVGHGPSTLDRMTKPRLNRHWLRNFANMGKLIKGTSKN